VGDIVQEGVAGTDGADRGDGIVRCSRHKNIVGRASKAIRPLHDNLSHARDGIGDEIAEGIGGQQRHVVHVLVAEQDAELQGIGLDVGPGRHAVAVGTGQ
jgi:hypothetical protein